jgi:hypothetical protein
MERGIEMTNEQALTLLEHAEYHLLKDDDYWREDGYTAVEQALVTIREAWKAVGPLGQIPSWERGN